MEKKDKARFLKAAKENNIWHTELILSMISDYVEKHEENKAAEKLHYEADLIKRARTQMNE